MLTVILCAAGSGTRAGLPAGENKILAEWNGMPVLCYSLSAFEPIADEILIPCRREDEKRIRGLLSPYPSARTLMGGATRAESVLRALQEAKGDRVLIHDAARPFVTPEVIRRCIIGLNTYGTAVCAVPAVDTVVRVGKDGSLGHFPRKEMWSVQTPQAYLTERLLSAYEQAIDDGRLEEFTDESGLYAAYDFPPHLVEGDRRNVKLTYAEDLTPGERIGFGVDTHAFAHQQEIDRGIARLNLNYIPLCGVAVPSDRGLEAHSDGDVPVHALMDALLTAIGEGDIGHLFPDTDPAYKGANSMELLARVVKRVHDGGFRVKNASVTILCERPRLAPYIKEMRENLQAALDCESVGVAAGTNEKLGYIGEGRGITAYAAVLLSHA